MRRVQFALHPLRLAKADFDVAQQTCRRLCDYLVSVDARAFALAGLLVLAHPQHALEAFLFSRALVLRVHANLEEVEETVPQDAVAEAVRNKLHAERRKQRAIRKYFRKGPNASFCISVTSLQQN